MESIKYAELYLLVGLVSAWCALHSAMISIPVTDCLQGHLGSKFRFYRLFFNLTSFLTLIPVILFASSVQAPVIFDWTGYMRIVQVFLLGIALLMFLLGARHYDAGQFLGLKQIRDGNSSKLLSDKNDFNTSGVLGVTRHPWYLGAMLLIWARPLDVSAIFVNAILTAYLIVGTYLEERKLIREFGDKYREYQQQVSMLFPLKWLNSKIFVKQSANQRL